MTDQWLWLLSWLSQHAILELLIKITWGVCYKCRLLIPSQTFRIQTPRWSQGNTIKIKTTVIFPQVSFQSTWVWESPFLNSEVTSYLNVNLCTQCLAHSRCSKDTYLVNYQKKKRKRKKATTEYMCLLCHMQTRADKWSLLWPLDLQNVRNVYFCFSWFPMVSG